MVIIVPTASTGGVGVGGSPPMEENKVTQYSLISELNTTEVRYQ
jgi:hypothetical protein